MKYIDKTMENEELDVEVESQDIDTTKVSEEVEETETDDNGQVEELKKQIETLTKQKEHWREKAIGNKSVKTETKPEVKTKELSTLDIVALSKANIAEEDLPEVIEYAKFKKISIAEALKSSIIKTTLSEKEDNRRANEASATGKTRNGLSKTSEKDLLDNAKRGNLPKENDDDAIIKLARAAVKNR